MPPNPSPAAPAAPDPRTLSLAQLQRLAGQGSRRARAELERRMQPAAPAPTPMRPPAAPAAPPRHTAPAPAPDQADALLQSWQLVERQQLERARADGPPRLLGLVLIGWGLLLGLGGLALLARSGNAYYLLCGLACAAVGALLVRVNRWAAPLHGVLIALMLAWAWRASAGLPALLQAAPLWIPAAWMAVPAARQPLR